MGPDLPITLVWRRWDNDSGETIIAVVVVFVAVVVIKISKRRTTNDARITIVD